MARRHLRDLYVTGKFVDLDDGSGEPVTVYVKKMVAAEKAIAIRKANAAKAVVLMARHEDDNELLLSIKQDILEMRKEDIIEYIANIEIAKKTQAIEAEIAAEDKWAEEGLLQGLQDAWYDHLMYESDDNPEKGRVKAKLEEFVDEVTKVTQARIDDIKTELKDKSEKYLVDKLSDIMLDAQGNATWLREFKSCQVWLSVRDPEDRRTAYFESREEVDELAPEIFMKLLKTYEDLEVDSLEGKDLPEIATSLLSPEPVETPVMDEDSGQKVAAV